MKLFVTIVALLVSVAAGAAATAQPAGAIRRVARPIANRYIVVLRGQEDSEAVGLQAAAIHRGRLRHVYRRAVRGFSIRLPEAAARALARDPRVLYVEEDGQVMATSVQSAAGWGLDRIDQRALPLSGDYRYGHDGTGVNAYVIDTGIRGSHAEFGGRAFVAGDFVDDDADGDPNDLGNDDANSAALDGEDCHGHGTHVAGTIGGATYGVAKNVTLWAYRVLDCTGYGSTSGVIAAVDAVTDYGRRPAVVNMSLGGAASPTLDAAIRRSIAAGFTYVVAAGNAGVDASTSSPARVSEAITVGATGPMDVRASFSNVGTLVDLFAPGESIRSAGIATNTATTIMSGTSMASPHVAGIVALYLETHASATPATVQSAVIDGATTGVVGDAGPGSPDRLAYADLAPASPPPPPTPPSVAVLTPNGGERVFTGASYLITWNASDPDGLSSFDVEISTDNGAAYAAVAGCTGLTAAMRQCTWNAPGPAATGARIRVVARDALGAVGTDTSNAAFAIVSGAPAVTVTSPNTAVNWGRGSHQQVKWTHNLGSTSYMRIEISRDGGTTYQAIAPAVKNTGSTSGVFDWTVNGAVTTAARIRVSWTNGPASDVSNAAFVIAEPYIKFYDPAAGASWGYGTQRRHRWGTNLGPGDRIELKLSVDGGATYSIALGSNLVGTALNVSFATPTLGTPATAARVRAVWTNAGAGFAASVASPNFRIEAPYVRVTAPNGGDVWTAGTSVKVKWTDNLGTQETVRVDLSKDNGQTYGTSLVTIPSDGSESVTVSGAWIAPAARVRIAWTRNAAIGDASDAAFQIR
jgi:subtilisin family serine protease